MTDPYAGMAESSDDEEEGTMESQRLVFRKARPAQRGNQRLQETEQNTTYQHVNEPSDNREERVTERQQRLDQETHDLATPRTMSPSSSILQESPATDRSSPLPDAHDEHANYPNQEDEVLPGTIVVELRKKPGIRATGGHQHGWTTTKYIINSCETYPN